jgi:hypothetical protein
MEFRPKVFPASILLFPQFQTIYNFQLNFCLFGLLAKVIKIKALSDYLHVISWSIT